MTTLPPSSPCPCVNQNDVPPASPVASASDDRRGRVVSVHGTRCVVCIGRRPVPLQVASCRYHGTCSQWLVTPSIPSAACGWKPQQGATPRSPTGTNYLGETVIENTNVGVRVCVCVRGFSEIVTRSSKYPPPPDPRLTWTNHASTRACKTSSV